MIQCECKYCCVCQALVWPCAFTVSCLSKRVKQFCVYEGFAGCSGSAGQRAPPRAQRTLVAFRGLSPHVLSLKKMRQKNYSVNI